MHRLNCNIDRIHSSLKPLPYAHANASIGWTHLQCSASGSMSAAGSSRWWYIHGRAYDLQPWLDTHPGGRYMLDITRGTDCTALFESYHAASLRDPFIRATLAKHAAPPANVVPPVVKSQAQQLLDWKNTPVYDDLKVVVRSYRRVHGIKATDSPATVSWYILWGVVHYISLARWFLGWGGWANSVVLGLGVWFWAGDLTHSGTHYALTYSSAPNEWVAWVGGSTWMVTSAWVRQHVVGHHVATNVPGRDPDLCVIFFPHFVPASDPHRHRPKHPNHLLGSCLVFCPIYAGSQTCRLSDDAHPPIGRLGSAAHGILTDNPPAASVCIDTTGFPRTTYTQRTSIFAPNTGGSLMCAASSRRSYL